MELGAAAGARPPRPVLELPPHRADTAARRAPAAALFKRDINLAGYLPLDAHPDVGNNAILARELGCDERTSRSGFTRAADRPRGTRSRRRCTRPTELLERVHRGDRDASPSCSGAAPERIGSIGIVSGLRRATRSTRRSQRAGRVPHGRAARARHGRGAQNCGIHFIAAGHYATETFGVRRPRRPTGRNASRVEHVFVEHLESGLTERLDAR